MRAWTRNRARNSTARSSSARRWRRWTDKEAAYTARLTDMNQRILRSMIANHLFDDPAKIGTPDIARGEAAARAEAAAGTVLLKNDGILPLLRTAKRIAVIGGYANIGVMSGGGSSQVAPQSGPALAIPTTYAADDWQAMLLMPGAPVKAHRGACTRRPCHFRRWRLSGLCRRPRQGRRCRHRLRHPMDHRRPGCARPQPARQPGRADRGGGGGQSPHHRGAGDRRAGADALAGQGRGGAGGLVSRASRAPTPSPTFCSATSIRPGGCPSPSPRRWSSCRAPPWTGCSISMATPV